jgi:outer membrane protein assembly factor BamB
MTIEQGLFYLILYNEDNQEIVYDIKLPNEYANDALPVVFDNKVVIPAAGEIYCMDIFTKEVLWKDKSNLRYMDLFYQDGTVLVGLWGDGNDKILAYNAVTGNLLWQNDLMESFSSTYQVLNGIVYFVSNNLYAVDFKTGKEYWNIACPDQKMDHEAYFRNHCVVIPGKNGQKGKIIANSGMSTICYEAIQ